MPAFNLDSVVSKVEKAVAKNHGNVVKAVAANRAVLLKSVAEPVKAARVAKDEKPKRSAVVAKAGGNYAARAVARAAVKAAKSTKLSFSHGRFSLKK